MRSRGGERQCVWYALSHCSHTSNVSLSPCILTHTHKHRMVCYTLFSAALTSRLKKTCVLPAALTHSTLRTLPADPAHGRGVQRRVQAAAMVMVTTATAHQHTTDLAATRTHHTLRGAWNDEQCQSETNSGWSCGAELQSKQEVRSLFTGHLLLIRCPFPKSVCVFVYLCVLNTMCVSVPSPDKLQQQQHRESGSSAHSLFPGNEATPRAGDRTHKPGRGGTGGDRY